METRKPLIAGNWKMYKTAHEARSASARLRDLVGDLPQVDVMIAPAFTALVPVAQVLEGSPIAVGAQNCHWEREGAYTGEVSPHMLRAVGCTHVLIGHSERRQYFQETDESVNKKIHAALAAGLIPVLCVGETQNERDDGRTLSVLDRQVGEGLKGIHAEQARHVVIAYEPVWAIGTGRTATREQAQEAHAFIRDKFRSLFGEKLANGLRILYGGSVKPENIRELMEMPDIDGALVGGASLDPDTFAKIVCFR